MSPTPRRTAGLLLTATAALGTGLSAQTLVYDNGPIETSTGESLLQDDEHGLNAYGFGIQAASSIDNAAIDDFLVNQTMQIDEVEIFAYQTGSSTSSPITGVFLEFYDQDPSTGAQPMAGSPGIANNLLTPSSTNQFSGIYRERETAPGRQQRPIMQVRVALPVPLILSSGLYWLRIQASGDPSLLGPWMPPITTLDLPVTSLGGSAMQFVGLTGQYTVPITSGPANANQSLPFRFFGSGPLPGSLAQTSPGCGTISLHVSGAPVPGGYVRAVMDTTAAFALIGYGFNFTTTPYCGCTVGHEWLQAVPGRTDTLRLPLDLYVSGVNLGVQGVDLESAGGCTEPTLSLTETYRIAISQ